MGPIGIPELVPGWMSLTQIIPVVNVLALFYLAFAEWPIRRHLEHVKSPQSPL